MKKNYIDEYKILEIESLLNTTFRTIIPILEKHTGMVISLFNIIFIKPKTVKMIL